MKKGVVQMREYLLVIDGSSVLIREIEVSLNESKEYKFTFSEGPEYTARVKCPKIFMDKLAQFIIQENIGGEN